MNGLNWKPGVLALILGISLTGNACLDLSPSPYQDLSPLAAAALGTQPITSVVDPGTFVMMAREVSGTGGAFLESTDGLTWTVRSISGPARLIKVYRDGNNLYGLDGSTNGVVWKSIDGGLTWASITVHSDNFAFTAVTACNDTVILGQTGGQVESYVSPDAGISWGGSVPVGSSTSGFFYGLSCNGARFFATYNDMNYFASSADNGASWNPVTPGTSPLGTAAVHGSTVVLPRSGMSFATSTDSGDSFTSFSSTYTDDGQLAAVGYVAAGFYSASFDSASQECRFRRSADGISGWDDAPVALACVTPNSWSFNALAGSGDIVLAGGRHNQAAGAPQYYPRLFRSADGGASWARVTLPIDDSTGWEIVSIRHIP